MAQVISPAMRKTWKWCLVLVLANHVLLPIWFSYEWPGQFSSKADCEINVSGIGCIYIMHIHILACGVNGSVTLHYASRSDFDINAHKWTMHLFPWPLHTSIYPGCGQCERQNNDCTTPFSFANYLPCTVSTIQRHPEQQQQERITINKNTIT